MKVVVGKKPRPQVSVTLWGINRWLRWTGLRLFISYAAPGEPDQPTRLGVVFWGWK